MLSIEVSSMMRLIYRLLAATLGLLGFAGCSEMEPMYAPPYVPHATYVLGGHVISADEKKPIIGIEVSFSTRDTVTDANGAWMLWERGTWCDDACSLAVRDIDGDDNGGKFKDKKIPLSLTKVMDGDDRNYGTYEQHSIVIELDPDTAR
jgi:putative lipoprotein (rSAM/lipoprotein system)